MKNIIQTIASTFSNENLVLGTDNGVLSNVGYDDNESIYKLGVAIGDAAFAEVNTYKNELKPLLQKFVDQTGEMITQHSDKNPGELYNIIEVDNHVLVKELLTAGMLPKIYNTISF